MARAIWNGVVLAESENYRVVKNSVYFPPDSINRQYLKPSEHHTVCPWNGVAYYFDLVVNGMELRDGAWYYPSPGKDSEAIRDHVVFWRGVRLVK